MHDARGGAEPRQRRGGDVRLDLADLIEVVLGGVVRRVMRPGPRRRRIRRAAAHHAVVQADRAPGGRVRPGHRRRSRRHGPSLLADWFVGPPTSSRICHVFTDVQNGQGLAGV